MTLITTLFFSVYFLPTANIYWFEDMIEVLYKLTDWQQVWDFQQLLAVATIAHKEPETTQMALSTWRCSRFCLLLTL